MNKKILILALTGALTLGISNAAFAWGINLDSNNRTYGISNASTKIDMGLTKKQASKLAKKLNKIEKKDSESPPDE